MSKTYVIDIDNHILFSKVIKETSWIKKIFFKREYSYELQSWDKEEIEKINLHYEGGDIIILYTGRKRDIRKLTKKQLAIAGVKYHKLVMNKPVGIYVDKESRRSIDESTFDK